ncbi:MAG: IMP dehydrogenase [Caldilineaceae bacterium]|nr:IMP dehydrogenase [Caldilineaceae bacterium]
MRCYYQNPPNQRAYFRRCAACAQAFARVIAQRRGPLSRPCARDPLPVGGLRSALSYGGAFTIAEMQEESEFIEITPAGVRESGSHDVSRI